MALKIRFEITTPERTVFSDEVDEVILPTPQGEIGVLPNHIPLVSLLSAGELRIKKGGETIYMAVSGGFLQVRPDKVVVLSDTAERAEEIDETKADEARKRAQELVKEKRVDASEFARLSAKIEKELARLKVARKRRNPRQQPPPPAV
ncbi:MAG: F0F1 ATP synthase subunit epsilon [Patescibacteria group bacterium]|nr:F0F1 ATP synthase subunit epsilon [Patescibacteria group bacterium]MDD5716117.1 F0F1 ATP synthase subunit epsilon [Patescibacteria group bacterium]